METAKKPFSELFNETVFCLRNCAEFLEKLTPKNADNKQPHETDLINNHDLNVQNNIHCDPDACSAVSGRKRNKKKKKKRAQKKDCVEEKERNLGEWAVKNQIKNGNIANMFPIHRYKNESQMEDIMNMIGGELSEPYSIYTYRYFINRWPHLCLLVYSTARQKYVGVIVGKTNDDENGQPSVGNYLKGYIAMLAVDKSCRKKGLGTLLVSELVSTMYNLGCSQISLETEVSNKSALNLYGRIGFIRENRLFRYYLNGGDAFRLQLRFKQIKLQREKEKTWLKSHIQEFNDNTADDYVNQDSSDDYD